MKIGLIDVDGHNFPNLALMKISAYHKAKGDQVEWCVPLKHYDRVYQSKVFDDTYAIYNAGATTRSYFALNPISKNMIQGKDNI